ncbi:MAG: aldehyde dehydrogenase [Bdellovibrionaceae bacterium]|nr:aldehyde dehydrogenase [Pseudobdellovibrionaceae bacterium]
MIQKQNTPIIQNYIGGKLQNALSGKTMPTYEPATGDVLTTLPVSDAPDVEAAVQAAQKAFPMWSGLTINERSAYLRRLSQLVEERLDDLAIAETLDNGKPLQVSRTVDIPRAAYNLRFYADAITQFTSESYNTSQNVINFVQHEPIGVVGCISPWNLPLYSFTWKIAPALAAGNCVVGKPSEITPLTAFLFSQICIDAGLPPGVLNIVHGTGAEVGQAINAHPKIRAISFTGSTVTGEKIAQTAAPQFKKLALEMGGKNPTIVFSDCDFERTVNEVARAAFSNQGQICLCGSRIFIEESIYHKFVEALVAKTQTLIPADPLLPGSQQGAVVSKAQYDKVLSYIALAKEEGGRILCGGKPAKVSGRCETGWFIEPTLIDGLSNSCRTNQEEIFGPVATLMPFKDESDVLHLANDVKYGLSASLFTQDISRAHRVAKNIHSGIVWINTWMNRDLRTPFGGIKSSGMGREGGMEALRFFTEPKTICVQI